MSARDPRSVIAEADAWSALLDELRELNEAVGRQGLALAEMVGPVVVLAIAAPSHYAADADAAAANLKKATNELLAMQRRLNAMIATAGERATALRAEVGP